MSRVSVFKAQSEYPDVGDVWVAECSIGTCEWLIERKRWGMAFANALAHAREHRRRP